MSEPSSGILGRISGKLLAPNLVRNGYDLTFRNGELDPDILYLDVNNMRVGINTVPSFDLHVDSTIKSTNWESTNQIVVGNNDIIIDNGGTISSLSGAIIIRPNQINPSISIQRNITDELEINDNFIRAYNSNSNLEIDPTLELEILNDTNITGNLNVTGTINIAGNLTKQGNLIIGDDVVDLEQFLPENDTVDFNAPLSQDLKPGITNTYNLGRDSLDSTPGRWGNVYITDNFVNTTNINANAATISDQIFINGLTRQIDTLQSNDDLVVVANSNFITVEDIKFESSGADNIINLNNTPIVFNSTGDGYVQFSGTSAFVIPAGTTAERVGNEVGETRWNTTEQYLECFDGTTWNLSTGVGEVTQEYMQELGNIYTLILG